LSTPAIHERFDRAEGPHALSSRPLGLAFATVFALIGCSPLLHRGSVRWWAVGVSVGFATAALIFPALLNPLARVWTKVAAVLNRVLTLVAMALLFFLVITPAGLIRRIFVSDPLRCRIDPNAGSYWIERQPPGPAPDSMVNQF